MRYKKLGNTDMNLSVLTVGTWGIGGIGWGPYEKKESIDAIRAMIDNGVNHIDAAWIYGLGYSDKVIGEAIKGMRDKVYITEKAGFRNSKDGGPNYVDCSTEFMTSCFEESMRNLNVDYVDVFMIHAPDPKTPLEETAELLNRWKKQGKIRYFGVSNFPAALIEEVSKYLDVVAIQSGYSMVMRGEEDNLKWAHERNIGVMTHSSLGSGILTGAFRELPKLASDDVRVVYGLPQFKEPQFSQTMELLKTLDKIAAAHNATVAQVAINWNTQKPYVDTSLVGVKNAKQANENCKGTEWVLTDEEMNIIDAAIEATVGK